MGPTCSGKTDLALKLAQLYPIEIISVDSAMIYRGMNIGTAKPSESILKSIPHHCINLRTPIQSYSVADFINDCYAAIADIQNRNKLPILVGGTMLYFHALQQGLNILPATDDNVRKELRDKLTVQGLDVLYQELQQVDLLSARKIHPHDTQRILRGLEIYRTTGRTWTSFLCENNFQSQYDWLNIALSCDDRKLLHQLIDKRFNYMLQQGLLDELKYILSIYPQLNLNYASLRCVGYKQLFLYLQNNMLENEATSRAIIASRQLAKRQFTWLRRWQNLEWFDFKSDNLVELIVSLWLSEK